ncbi:MAG: SAM-dependent methyltransferase [Woeseia sp.]
MPTIANEGLKLPQPDAESRAHSERVAALICQAIASSGGSISFAEFMQHALYAPGLGYYSAGATKLGAAGDFITAPEISPLFARILARQCALIAQCSPVTEVLELGAGSGSLALEMLRSLPRHGVELERYAILEVSPDLRSRQESLIRSQAPKLITKVEWLDSLPRAFSGVVIANEVADALPVERFQRTSDGVLQFRVVTEDGRFVWQLAPAPPFLEDAVLRVEHSLGARLPEGYISDISTGLAAWIEDVARRVETGFMFLFDYGVTRREYYAADRSGGWIRCHFRHHAHNDPLVWPGIQDLSAWVDFTALAEGASDAGLEVAGFVSQSQFLLNGGLEDELAGFERLPTAAQLELSRQVKMLTLPGEMGEHFKCLGLSRRIAASPAAFATGDRTHTL